MSEYVGKARSNYFRVKNVDAFRRDCARHAITVGDWDSSADLILDDSPSNEPQGAIAVFSRDTWPHIDVDNAPYDAGENGVACNLYEVLEENPRKSDLCSKCDQPRASHSDEPWDYAECIADIIAKHLVDGDVAILMEVGHEKLRSLGGFAVAVNSQGGSATVDLDGIYDLAKSLGASVTHAYS